MRAENSRIPSLDLMEYVEQNILPRYAAFDKGHGLSHVTTVIKNSIDLANRIGIDVNMCYVIAAYHDLGLSGPRAVHHLTSGKILLADTQLRRWFSSQQLIIMKEAVEDHRASASRMPRSMYGKVVAEADRNLSPDTVVRRAIQFSISKNPDYTQEQHWQRVSDHLENKYSVNGYIHLWIQNSPNEERLRILRTLIKDKKALRTLFDKLYQEETNIENLK